MNTDGHGFNLRGAAGDAREVWSAPVGLTAREEMRGGDLLADLALRVMGMVVGDLTERERAGMGLVVGTTMGCLEMDREFERSRMADGGRYASPAAFSRTLPSTVMAEMAMRFGVKGPGLVVSAGDCSTAMAIRRAAAWMEGFGLEFCLAGGMEWIGEEVRVGLVLLGRGGGIGRMEFGEFVRGDLRAVGDESLGRVMEWVRGSRLENIGAGIRLIRIP